MLTEPRDFAVPIWPASNEKRLAGVPTWANALVSLDAIRLIQLGARAGLVSNVTGIEKTVANRLYRQIHGRPSPPGLTPFTDTWFLKNDRRRLHANLVWRFHKEIRGNGNNAASQLTDLFEIYRLSTSDTLLDIMHVAFVPKLVEMKLWRESRCDSCAVSYIGPVEDRGTLCPACRLHQRFRCATCGARAQGLRRGRRRSACSHCGKPSST